MHGVPQERVYEGGGITEHTTQGEGVSSPRRFPPTPAKWQPHIRAENAVPWLHPSTHPTRISQWPTVCQDLAKRSNNSHTG